MTSPEIASEMVARIARIDGALIRDEFVNTSGIRGNVKIDLPKALELDPELDVIMTEQLVENISDLDFDIIAAFGGATRMARRVAEKMDKERLVIEEYHIGKNKHYRVHDHNLYLVVNEPRVVFIEGVTSTLELVEQAAKEVHIYDNVQKLVVGWRRGRVAPTDMTIDEIKYTNNMFNFRELYEYPQAFPVEGVIKRFIPLWVPVAAQLSNYLPESRQ